MFHCTCEDDNTINPQCEIHGEYWDFIDIESLQVGEVSRSEAETTNDQPF